MAHMHKQPKGLGDRVNSVGAWLQDYGTALRDGQFKPFTKTERKVRAATRNKPWGPTGTELNELAELTYSPADCEAVMNLLAWRLAYPADKWRNVYKALTVLEFLLRRGSDAAVARARAGFTAQLEQLRSFAYVAPDGRDLGQNVQHRSAAILALLADEPRLLAEREAFQKKRRAYDGFSREHMLAYSSVGSQPGSPHANGSTSAELPLGSGEDAASPSLRNAGETKGVSMEANARHLAALKRLLDRPENRACADCSSATPASASRSSWASINTGTFLCMRCAGIHRGLGVHVSKVRSCTLDTWLPEQVEFMAHTGNAVANAYWEAKLPGGAGGRPRSPSLAEQEAFIRRKYIGKEFAEGAWPPAQPFEDEGIRAILADLALGRAGSGAAAAAAAAAAAVGAETNSVQAAALAPNKQAVQPPADLISLIDLHAEPLAEETVVAAAAAEAATEAAKAAADPMRGLEQVFSSARRASEPGTAAAPGAAAAAPAANLSSWDMGARLAAEAQAQQQQAAAAAQPQAPAQPAYCPPWAPQHPEAQRLAAWQQGAAQLAIMPAGAAFNGFHAAQPMQQQQQAALTYHSPYPALPAPPLAASSSVGANGWAGSAQQQYHSTQWQQRQQTPAAPVAAPARGGRPPVPPLQLPVQAAQPSQQAALGNGLASPMPPSPAVAVTPAGMTTRRTTTPATPQEKAEDILRGSLDSFLTHSETVSARKPSPGQATGQGLRQHGAPLSSLKHQQPSPGPAQAPNGIYQASAWAL